MIDPSRPIKRLTVAIALSLLVLYAAGPLLRDVDLFYYNYGQEARAASEEIQSMPARQLNTMLKEQGRPSVVLMYASWCGYCQKQIPNLLELKKEYDHRISFFFISIDQSKAQLAAYLLQHYNKDGLTTYHMPASEFNLYQTFFRQFGGEFRGGIPYMGVFDASGEMVLEIPGMVPKESLKEALEEVLKSPASSA